ncbi:MAG: hypothetical protein ABI563_08235 [Specibacter sp.]
MTGVTGGDGCDVVFTPEFLVHQISTIIEGLGQLNNKVVKEA